MGVSLDTNRSQMNQAEQDAGIIWPMAQDPYKQITKRWGVTAVPTTVLIDPNGLIYKENVTAAELDQILSGR